MSVRMVAWTVALVGLTGILLFAVGSNAAASIVTLLQLGGLVGAPLAVGLNPVVRSWPAVGVIAVALSISLSALATQSLIWLGLANQISILAAATAYGTALGLVLDIYTDETEMGGA